MNSRFRTLTSACALLLLATACSNQQPKTLGSLNYEPEDEPPARQRQASHDEVRTEYEELAEMVEDEDLKEQIERRVGDVYMAEGEEKQLEEPEGGDSYYLEAIKSYRDILEKYPNSPDNAEILYQLAKAYDMEGDQDEALEILRELTRRHPGYENIAEAHFRKGDILFNRGDYQESETAYAAVTEHPQSKFLLNAHYMLGWSQYKQLRFDEALDDFILVLNTLLGDGTKPGELEGDRESLVDDTLHAVSLSLDKLDGAASVQQRPALKDRAYVWRVYDNLGQYYLDKELYEASARSYREFVRHHGDSDRAPVMHRSIIETYMEGSFPGQAFEEKEAFVAAYGIDSDYAQDRDGISDVIRDDLKAYLDELGRNYHARGQELQTELTELKETEPEEAASWPHREKVNELDEEAVAALDNAAHFHQQFIDTFPQDESVDERFFMRAEALFAARRYGDAIGDYEHVAYEAGPDAVEENGADAGYAAILAYENHIESLDSRREKSRWQSRAVESMLRYAENYHRDDRSASVLTNAAEYMFDLEEYQRALAVSRELVEDNPELDAALKKTAYGISAHSLFQLERFHDAGEDYLRQRQLVDAQRQGEEYRKITERLATSVYKHAEGLMDGEQNQTAVEQLLRLKTLTPDSPVRVTAQYDAATLLLNQEKWSAAIAELEDLRQRYPEHELAVEFPRKLAFAHEQNEDWSQAAAAYLALSEEDPDEEPRREALYLAGTMYEKAEEYAEAIAHLRDYAHAHPEPFGTNMEARYKLAQNYGRTGEPEKRRFWLNKLVEGHRQAGDQQTERSNWLAAWANNEYGDHHAERFRELDFHPPLDQTLPPKNEALDKATERYEMAADSGIFDFVTMSAYKIGELYREFAGGLRESPRPEGLTEDEQGLYADIIEEQAQPFDELAMQLHLSNVERGWDGDFDQWIDQSFAAMRQLHPARFAKQETIVSYGDEIR